MKKNIKDMQGYCIFRKLEDTMILFVACDKDERLVDEANSLLKEVERRIRIYKNMIKK